MTATACRFVEHESGWRCTACGRVVRQAVRSAKPPMASCRRGLGDMVAAGLAAVGITKARVERLVGGPCGCQGRQADLNELGRKIGIG